MCLSLIISGNIGYRIQNLTAGSALCWSRIRTIKGNRLSTDCLKQDFKLLFLTAIQTPRTGTVLL